MSFAITERGPRALPHESKAIPEDKAIRQNEFRIARISPVPGIFYCIGLN